jgi:hypothetical protein
MQNKAAKTKMHDKIMIALIIHTWNLCRRGVTIKLLRYDLELSGFPKAK